MSTPENKPLLTGKEGEEFDLHVAAAWTKRHRETHPDQPVSHFYGRETLERILAQEGCVGIRFYHAYDEHGKKHIVLAGASADGKDQLAPTVTGGFQPHVSQGGMTCPGDPGCPKNALTGD